MIIQDESGNKIQNFKKGTIKLFLASEKRGRTIGVVNKQERWLTMRRKQAKHLHYKSNSYGFNYEVISRAKQFDKVLLTDETGSYLIPNKKILEDGSFLWFQSQGFERQIFLKLEEIKKYKVEPEKVSPI
jgi:hypothetical protein